MEASINMINEMNIVITKTPDEIDKTVANEIEKIVKIYQMNEAYRKLRIFNIKSFNEIVFV